jgi:polyisoprenoid-binding protein YceI
MHLNKLLLAALLGLGALASSAADAAFETRWASAEFRATVAGTSTLHDWSVESTAAVGEIDTTNPAAIRGSLRLAADSLANESNGLNSRMYAALKTDKYPQIRFEATAVERPTGPVVPGVPQTWSIHGRLILSGTTRELTLPARATFRPEGTLLLETETPLKMTDFGIKPPTFMGMVRTGDAVTVKIRWLLNRSVP